MIKDCPNIRMNNERTKFKSKRVYERAIVAMWNENDSSWSESEDEKITNLCLMATQKLRENNESEEITLEYLLTFLKEYLPQGLLTCVKFKQNHISKIKGLRKGTKFLKKKTL